MLTEDDENRSSTQNAFMSRHNNKSGKSQVIRKDSVECYKCGLTGHRKSQCHGKPCVKYIEYCKNTYGCKLCKCKAHFANECPNKNKNESKSNRINDKILGERRALITVSLSFANVKKELVDGNCWYQDCGATQHMSSIRNGLSVISP
ncbi:hypothetical protein WA026_001750 [Henosepilachna vigintioctopunctata]|uniref:CCHC-type domain-containing protein n=1 Tax=Henosepilachna vigintioctopunctata TaxID=420089 RepID=A0AAW1UQU2_9CUCU